MQKKDALWKSQGSWSAFEQIREHHEVRVGKERCVEFRTPGEEDIIRKKKGDVSDDDDDVDDDGFRIRKGLECHEVRVNRTRKHGLDSLWIREWVRPSPISR